MMRNTGLDGEEPSAGDAVTKPLGGFAPGAQYVLRFQRETSPFPPPIYRFNPMYAELIT